MEDHGVIFPELSEATKEVMCAKFYEAFRDNEWERIMQKLGYDAQCQQMIHGELSSLSGFFRRVWTREAKEREAHK